MTTTISGTSGVTYPSGGIDNVAGAGVGTTDTQTLTNKTLTTPTLTTPTIDSASVSTVSGTAPLFMARAWVNFNGTTATPSTIRASGNVSSITKASTGSYTINFTTAMTDANYVPVCCHDSSLVSPGGTYGYWVFGATAPTTTGFAILSVATNSGASVGDPTYATWAVFR